MRFHIKTMLTLIGVTNLVRQRGSYVSGFNWLSSIIRKKYVNEPAKSSHTKLILRPIGLRNPIRQRRS